MSFADKLRNADSVDAYLAELKLLVEVLVNGCQLKTAFREGKRSYVFTEPDYLRYPNQMIAAKQLTEESPGFGGFTYRLVKIMPKFKIPNPNGAYWYTERAMSSSVVCTEEDEYEALEIRW